MPRLTFKRPLGFGECTACMIDSHRIVGWWAAERAACGGVGRGCMKMMRNLMGYTWMVNFPFGSESFWIFLKFGGKNNSAN